MSMEGATGFICSGQTVTEISVSLKHFNLSCSCIEVSETAALHSGLCPASVGANISLCVTSTMNY